MTYKKAIEILKNEWRLNSELFGKQFDEALELAIKTLEERPTGEWIPINEETIKTLQDHHYYLVAHKCFKTPMKAKYYNDGNKHFEVFFSKSSQIAHIFFESTDDITHFMELPELPKREEAAADE